MARQFHSEITFPVHAQIEAADLEAFRTGRVAARWRLTTAMNSQ